MLRDALNVERTLVTVGTIVTATTNHRDLQYRTGSQSVFTICTKEH
jgi:hypothetical protein